MSNDATSAFRTPEHLLADMATQNGEDVAWRDLLARRELTLRQWDSDANRFGRGLQAKGVKRGDRVAMGIDSSEPLEWLIAYVGIHRIGAVAVPLSTRLSLLEVERVLTHCDPSALVVSDDALDRWPQRIGAQGEDVPIAATNRGSIRATSWNETLSGDDSRIDLALDPTEIRDILYTSGTTGRPKGVVVRHVAAVVAPGPPPLYNGLGFLNTSPFWTTSGVLLAFSPLRVGMTGLQLSRFDAARWLRAVEEDRPVAGFLVPAMAQLLVADPHLPTSDLSSLVSLNIGSAPIAPETIRRVADKMPSGTVSVGYGMAEFGAVSSVPARDEGRHIGSVGVPLKGVEVQILDGDDVCAAGNVGEIAVRGATGAREYFRDPEESATTWRNGWLRTGDLGYLDADGFLWVTGRKVEMIIRGGNNIFPGEVEAALLAHHGVADAAAMGVPHQVLGEDVVAWVVLGDDELDKEQLRGFLLERLADYKVPRRLLRVAALPRNEAGKVVKAELGGQATLEW